MSCENYVFSWTVTIFSSETAKHTPTCDDFDEAGTNLSATNIFKNSAANLRRLFASQNEHTRKLFEQKLAEMKSLIVGGTSNGEKTAKVLKSFRNNKVIDGQADKFRE